MRVEFHVVLDFRQLQWWWKKKLFKWFGTKEISDGKIWGYTYKDETFLKEAIDGR